MTLNEVKQKCPLAYKKLVAYSKKYLLGFQQLQAEALEGEDYIVPPISDQFAEIGADGLLYGNWSQLGQFFSENDIDIDIVFTGEDHGHKMYSFRIHKKEGELWGKDIQGRPTAELKAYLKAFEILEKDGI